MGFGPTELLPGHSLAIVRENTERLQKNKSMSTGQARAVAFREARASLRRTLEDGVEVFRAGSYPGKRPVTEADLKEVERTYNEVQAGKGPRFEASAKQTHAGGQPALGWVGRISAQGRSLRAHFREASNELLNGIIEERYPNPSIELRESLEVDGRKYGLNLKSVAFLGADPPAVKEVAAFSEDEDGEQVIRFSFQEWSAQTGGQTVEGNTKHDINLNITAKTGAEDPAGDARTFSESELEAERQRIKRETEAEVRKEMQLKFEEERTQFAEEQRRESNLEFCEGLVKARKLAPAKRDLWAAVLNAIAPDLKFGEGKDSALLFEELKAELEGWPEDKRFSESLKRSDKNQPAGNDGEVEFGEVTQRSLDETKDKYGEDSKEYKAAYGAARNTAQSLKG